MKSLSIVIPSFNSEKYIQQCLDSLLIGRDEELDVIVVNDGSTDKTSFLAHEFAKKHSFVRVIDKENGGHGSGVNVGIKYAEGLYFKILDSDDVLDKDGLIHLLDVISINNKNNNNPDLYLADYCSYYEDITIPQATISFKKHMKVLEKVTTWESLPHLGISDFFMIHMTYVRTALLKEISIPLLEKTFYEDNQYLFYVLKSSKTIYYLDKFIYKYTVGRKGQSISLENMAKKYDHQYRVKKAVVDHITMKEYEAMDKPLKWQIRHELFKMSVLVYFYTYIGKGKERHHEYKDLYKYFKNTNPEIYKLWKYHTPSWLLWGQIPCFRHLTTIIGYKIFAKRKGWK